MNADGRAAVRMIVMAIGMVLITGSGLPVWSQEQSTENKEVLRDKLQAGRKAYVTENLVLTESEAKAFWPLYERYQKDLKKVSDRMIQIIEIYANKTDTMTEEGATKVVDQWLEAEHDRLDLQKAYLPKFRKILPSKKVTRYYQIEDKIFAIIYSEAMTRLPLVQ